MTATDPSPNHLQLTRDGQLRHFLTLDGLGRELLTDILDTADSFIEVGERSIKKSPCCGAGPWSTCFSSPVPEPAARLSLPLSACLQMY